MFPAQKARVRHVQAPNCQKIKGFVADFLKFFFLCLKFFLLWMTEPEVVTPETRQVLEKKKKNNSNAHRYKYYFWLDYIFQPRKALSWRAYA